MATELATAYVNLVSSAKDLGKDVVEQLGGAGDKGGAEAGDKAGKSFISKFKNFLTSGKGIATGAVVAGAAAAVKGLYNIGETFDDVGDTIRTGTGATGKDLEGLIDVAKNVGTQVPAEFGDIGSVVADLNTRLGVSGDTLEKIASQYLQAGNILGEDVDINATTAAFAAFGIEGDSVSGALDDLFRVSQATGVGMNELASNAQTQGATMRNLGFSFEDTVSFMGQLDKAGVNSQAVMASMSKGLATLAKDGKDPQEAFADVTAEIGKYVDAGDTAAAINVASEIFGTRGAAQFVGAVQSGTLAVDDLMASTGATSDTILGVADDTADLAEHWQVFKNKALLAVQPVASKTFDLLSSGVAAASRGFDKLLDAGKNAGAKLSPILKSGMKQAGDILESVWTAAEPGVTALVDAIKPLFKSLMDLMPAISPFHAIMEVLKPLLPQIAETVGTLAGIVAGALAQAFEALQPVIDVVVELVNRIIEQATDLVGSLLPPLASLFDSLAPLLDAVLDALMPIVTTIADLLIPIIEALMPVVDTVFSAIKPIIDAAMLVLDGLITFLTGVFSGDWSKAWEGIKKIVSGVVNLIKSILKGAWEIIKSVAKAAWNGIKSVITAPIEAAKDALDVAATAIGAILAKAWGFIKKGAKAAWGLVEDYILDPLKAAWDWISDTFSTVGEIISGAFDGLLDWIKKPINVLIEAVNWVIKKLNGLSFDVPSWVPGIGGNTFGFNLPEIPKLAAGGMTTRETLAVLGDNPSGRELVMPLDSPHTTAALAKALSEAESDRRRGYGDGPLIGVVNNYNDLDAAGLAVELDRRMAFAGA